MAKARINIRIDPDLLKKVDEYAQEQGISRTSLIELLLEHTVEGRFFVKPSNSPDPFPGNPSPFLSTEDYYDLSLSDLSSEDRKEAEKRFKERFERAEDECWVSLYSDPNKYAVFQWRNVAYKAHRFSYALFNGPIGQGLTVVQTCGNKGCVNPKHLQIG